MPPATPTTDPRFDISVRTSDPWRLFGGSAPATSGDPTFVQIQGYEPTFWDLYGPFAIQTAIVVVAGIVLIGIAAALYLYVRRREAAFRA